MMRRHSIPRFRLDPRGARQLNSIRTTRDCASSQRGSARFDAGHAPVRFERHGTRDSVPREARHASRDQWRTEKGWVRRVYGNERLAAKRSCDQERRTTLSLARMPPRLGTHSARDLTQQQRRGHTTVPLDSFGKMRRASALGCVWTRAGAVLGFGPSWGIRRAERTWQLRARRDGPAALEGTRRRGCARLAGGQGLA
ncbi:hypothetical protein C8R43DRAFT_367243 [Mycena crocata]|nr:hypothetical protein C8R43DRAFT_367243 [Mycena crocata]